jgi:F1F0 ATPase subunit 2
MEMDASHVIKALIVGHFAGDLALAPGRAMLVGLAAGTVVGAVHFGSLWWNTRLYASGGVVLAFSVQLFRFALLTIILIALAAIGAAALLAGAFAVLATRGALVRRLGRV